MLFDPLQLVLAIQFVLRVHFLQGEVLSDEHASGVPEIDHVKHVLPVENEERCGAPLELLLVL